MCALRTLLLAGFAVVIGCAGSTESPRAEPGDVGVDAFDASGAEDSRAPRPDVGVSDCPATWPTLGESCTFTSFCEYADYTAADAGLGCRYAFTCNEGRVGRAAALFAAGCPAAPPVNGTSCTCGWHLFGEADGGHCEYPCAGGKIVATCSGTGEWSTGPGNETWSVSGCVAADGG